MEDHPNENEQLKAWAERLRNRRPETAQSIRETDEIRYITRPVLVDIVTYVEFSTGGLCYIVHVDKDNIVPIDENKPYRVLIVDDNGNDTD